MSNDFSKLDAQSAESSFAQFTPEEHAEYQAWLDARAHEADTAIADDPRDPRDDADDESHHGWPGDGSGEDDLADLMAHGDEGCCDQPGD